MSGEPWAPLISEEQVLDLHLEGLRRHGGSPGNADRACVERSLGAAWSAEGYQRPDDAKEGFWFAAYLLVYLASNHCFTDGNKRVAWLACVHVLSRVNLTLEATDDEAEAMIVDVITHELEAPDVVRWLAGRVVLAD